MAERLSSVVADGPIQKVRFGNFEIVNDSEGRPLALGKGTFGRTYQARHCYLETIVALKIITERYVADPAVRQRFLIEARAVAKLSHPHIARLYDFGEADGVLHYAMEYCAGGSLADCVTKNGALGIRQVVEVAQQIAGALKCAHAAGFIHRDLKPSNIMLIGEGSPLFTKLIDFGLVQPSLPGATRSVADDQSADGARFLGTPLFASPEQLREEPMDVRTDLFSLGITLWYLLVGGPPETGSSAAIAASRLSAESYATRLPSDLPPQLKDVLARLLEKDRNRRFASAADAFNALNLCASILGFRRARDYTDPRAELGDFEEAKVEEQQPAQAGEPTPIEIRKVNAELASEFTTVARVHEDFTGLNYVATTNAAPDQSVILHILHPMLLQDPAAMDQLKIHVAQLKALARPELLRPIEIKQFSDYTAIVLEKPSGSDLLSILRIVRTVRLVEAAPLLESVADICDALSTARLPGVQLAPSRIFLNSSEEVLPYRANLFSKSCPKLYPRFLSVSEAPELARLNEPEDVSSTMTTDMLGDPGRADNMPEHFATLLYRIVAGRNCLAAASLSSQAYVPIPGLSEHSNQLLSLVIANQIATTSCGQILREVLSSEGIAPRVSSHPSAGFTVRSGGSTVTPVDVAPVNRLAQIATPTPTPALDKPGAALRGWQPPAVTPHPSTPPIVPKAPVATPPPTAIPQVTTPPPQPVEARAKDLVAPPLVPSPGPEIVEEEEFKVPPTEAKGVPKQSWLRFRRKSPEKTPTPITRKEDESRVEESIPSVSVTPPAQPVEARAKDLVAPPLVPSPGPEIVEEKESKLPQPIEAKIAPKKARFKIGRKSAEKEPARITGKQDHDISTEKVLRIPAPEETRAPVILPPPAATEDPAPTIDEQEPLRLEISWRNPKVRAIGIGIAALLVLSVSFGVARKVWQSARPSAPVAIAPPQKPEPTAAPVPAIAAGRYVGRLTRVNLRNRQTTLNSSAEFERQISIDPNSSTGYLIEYRDDLRKQIPLSDAHLDSRGTYTAHVMFSSATNGARNDENLTASTNDNNNVLQVTFQSGPNSSEQYAGTFHLWGSEDQNHFEKLIADRDAAAAAAQRAKEAEQARSAEEARVAAQREAAAKAITQEPQKTAPPKRINTESNNSSQQPAAATSSTTSTHQRQSSGGQGAKSAGSSSHQTSAVAAAPPPAPPTRPAPPKGQKAPPKSAFGEGPPGG